MQFTAAFVAAVMAISASAAAVPQDQAGQHPDDPRQATCLEPRGPVMIKTADCQAAIAKLKSDSPTINHGAGCTRDLHNEWEYTTVGTCKVIVRAQSSAHCQSLTKVAEGVEKIIGTCALNNGGSWEGGFEFEKGIEVRIQPTKRFGEQ